MGRKSINISRFFQELKHRKVIRVLVMYAAAAFIILQLADILTPALNLPPWIITIVIILLAIGFPVLAILSWIFDLTPEGMIKSEPIKDHDDENIPASGRRKFRFSDGAIIVLLIAVGVLLYPKIFKRDQFKNLRDTDGKISIAVMPFNNLTGDTLYNAWQGGFQNLIISTLSNSEELEVRQYQAIHELMESDINKSTASMVPAMAGNFAKKLNSKTAVMGNLIKAGDKLRINAQLLNSETEEIYRTFQAEGDNEEALFSIADTLSVLIRNYLEIEKIKSDFNSPEFQKGFITESSEAFRSYILGYDAFMSLEFLPAARWFYKAIQTDPNFSMAYALLSFSCHNMNNPNLAKEWVGKAYENSDNMPYKGKLIIDMVNSFYYETPKEQISFINQLLDLEEFNPFYWTSLGMVYFNNEDYENAVIYSEKSLSIYENWGSEYKNPFIYYILGYSLHQTGDHKREKEVLRLGLDLFPDHQLIVQTMAICALSHEENKKAEELINKYVSIRETVTLCPANRIEVGLGAIYAGAELLHEAEMKYRNALKITPDDPEMMNELSFFLIDKTNSKDKISEGLELIEKALKSDPNHWLYLDTKAWGLHKLGKNNEAYNIIRQSWEKRPSYNHEVFEHLQIIEKASSSREI